MFLWCSYIRSEVHFIANIIIIATYPSQTLPEDNCLLWLSFAGSVSSISQSFHWAPLWWPSSSRTGDNLAPKVSTAPVICKENGSSYEGSSGWLNLETVSRTSLVRHISRAGCILWEHWELELLTLPVLLYRCCRWHKYMKCTQTHPII